MLASLRTRDAWSVATGVLLAGALAAVLLTFEDFGITWDEPLHVEYGKLALDWYLSLGADRALFDYQNLYLYGALHDTAIALLGRLLPYDDFTVSHLGGALIGLLGFVGCYRVAVAISGSRRAGFLATALLLATPEYWGHLFNNPKDVPLAVAGIWTLFFLVRLAHELPPAADAETRLPRWSTLIGYGVALGAALGIRIAGVLLLAAPAAVLLAWIGVRVRAVGSAAAAAETARLAVRLLPIPAIAAVVMLLAWPWALLDPLHRPFQALEEFAKFPIDFSFTFAGVPVRTTELPWWYLPVGFAVKLPETMLAGLAVALGMAVRGLVHALSGHGNLRLDRLALAAAILLPPAVVIAAQSVLYDGIRHVLFLVPPMAVAAGIGFDRLADRLAPGARLASGALLALALAGVLMAMVRLHPYQGIYYNRMAGGVAGAEGRFELDYWGSALSEAARTLAQKIAASEGPAALERPYRIYTCGPRISALHHLPAAWRNAPAVPPYDFYIAFTRGPCDLTPYGPQILRIERSGVPLAVAHDLRGNGPDFINPGHRSETSYEP